MFSLALPRRCSRFDPGTVRVSVILPLHNEAQHLQRALNSILAQTFPQDRMEIVTIDGYSQDGTRDILESYRRRILNLRFIENPAQTKPAGLNIGMAASRGDIIIRVDSGSLLPPDYVQRCVDLLADTGAANVGGHMRLEGVGYMSKTIAIAVRSCLGVGREHDLSRKRSAYVATVHLGAFRREALAEVGGYDEELVREYDDELNDRLSRAGFGILSSSTVVSTFAPRGSFSGLVRQSYRNGYSRAQAIARRPGSARISHLAPAVLPPAILAAGLALILWQAPWILAPLAAYLGVLLVVAAGHTQLDPFQMPTLILVYISMHLSYGLGILAGLSKHVRAMLRYINDEVSDPLQD